MHPETELLTDIVELHRTLVPSLKQLPRQQARAAIRTACSDLVSMVEQYREAGHPDADLAEVLVMFAWLPASATPTTLDLVDAYR